MSKFLQWLCRAVVVAAASFGFTAPTAHAESNGFMTTNCDSEGADLQNKIDHAPSGSTIWFFGSCDDGPYEISGGKFLRLRGGSSGGMLSAPAGGDDCVVNVFGSQVWLSRHDIDATGARCGVRVSNMSHLFTEFESIDIVGGNDAAIIVENNSFASINDVEVSNSGGVGIDVQYSSSATLSNLMVTGHDVGVRVDTNSTVRIFGGDSQSLIENNDISGVECGFSGVLDIATQDFGTGNGTGAADNVAVDPACHLIGDASP